LHQLGKYQLIRKIAVGGMAEVFLAKAAGPMGFEKTLVVKRILPKLAADPLFVQMFLTEAKLAARLNHPNIAQIFDFGEAEGAYYIAMEHVDGPNLRSLSRRSIERMVPLPISMCAKIISYACEALGYAHEFVDASTGTHLSLIHRDISPENVILSRNGAVKVVDFGIAKAVGQSHQTEEGVVRGKISYMPPEQVQGKELDHRADIFALGVVFYELMTGCKPFTARTDVTIVQAILYEQMIPVVAHRPDIPEGVVKMLQRALAKDPDARYPNCRAFQSDLERFIASTGDPVGPYQLAKLIAQLSGSAAVLAASYTPPMASFPKPPPQLQPAAAAISPPSQATTPADSPNSPIAASVGAPAVAAAGAPPGLLPPPTIAVQPPPSKPSSKAADRRVETADLTESQHAKFRRALPALVGGLLLVGAAGFVLLRQSLTAVEGPPAAARREDPLPLASMEVDSSPAGEVSVNGKRVGVSPVRIWEQPGQIKVEVSGSDPIFSKEELFNLERGDNGSKRIVVQKGTLEVQTQPGTVVLVDGKLVGQTPLAPFQIYEGRHTIKLIVGSLKKEVSLEYVVRPGEPNVLEHKFR
jgi:serine/threonine protein kinase